MATEMHCSPKGRAFIADFEGGRSSDGLFHAYWDPWGKVWTIGFGETNNVHPGMTWTLAYAEGELGASLARDYEPAVRTLNPQNQNVFDAWCSIVWNLGTGAVKWDIGRLTKAGDLKGAAQALLQYDHAGGVRLSGLTRRRVAEGRLLTTPWVNPDPNHYGWYDHAQRHTPWGLWREADAARKYDEYRAMQTKHRHPHRNELAVIREVCGWFAARISTVAEESGWDSNHRRWRHDRFVDRRDGHRIA